MPFVRIHGNKILLLHSRRRGKKVEQLRLQEWDSVEEARAVVEDDVRWDRLCASIRATLGPKARWKPADVREKVEQALADAPRTLEKVSTVARLARQLSACLLDFDDPLSPTQKRALGQAEEALIRLIAQVPEALGLLHKPGIEEDWMEDYMETGSAEHLFGRGLDAWEVGHWDEAKKRFQAGLELDPDHVDLHVHAGLTEEIEENWSLALLHYEKAIELGRTYVDGLIEERPDWFVTSEAMRRKVELLTSCRMPKEHDAPVGQPCEDCIEDLYGEIGAFRNNLEVRPFLRALYNRALVLHRLGRHQEVIDTLEERCRYQDDPNSRSLQAEAYFFLGDYAEAERRFAVLHAGSCYVKSLIYLKLGRDREAMHLLLRGVFWNHIKAEMLLGRMRPDDIRWKGSVLPRDKQASEFFHEHQHYFKGESRWRNMLRLIMEDEDIGTTLDDLQDAIDMRDSDRSFRMDSFHWGLFTGSPDPAFLEQQADRLLGEMKKPSSGYWMPKAGSTITGTVEEKKTINWRLNVRGGTLYFRTRGRAEEPDEGETVRIKVAKCWRYKRSIYVSGELVEG